LLVDGLDGTSVLSQLGQLLLVGGLLVLLAGGEDDNLGHVGLDALDVVDEGMLRLVGSALVDCESDGQGLSGGNSSSLELLEGESSSKLDLEVVTTSGGVYNGAEGLKRSGEDGSSLGLSLLLADSLLGGLA